MKKPSVLITILLMYVISLSAQESLTLTFSGRRGDGCYQRMDYLTVRNTIRDWQETLYYPDTTFIINSFVSVESVHASDLISVTPNPFRDEFQIGIELPRSSNIVISIYETTGLMCALYQSSLASGFYSFTLRLGKPQMYLLSITLDDFQYTAKVVNHGSNGNNQIELTSYSNTLRQILTRDSSDHPFEYGDIMEYVGYVYNNGSLEASNNKIQPQYENEDIILHFDALLPEVTTDVVTDITLTTATCGGEVVYDGGVNVADRGICWSTDPEPTIDGIHASCGEGMGFFSVQLEELNSSTTYFVRSYAINSAGTSYGNEVSFTTEPSLPILYTSEVTDITQTSATCGGEVTYDGGTKVIDKGVCWSTDPEPTISGTHVSCGEGIGSFSTQLTELTPNTTYYVRCYAINNEGIGYGNEVSFITTAFLPIVTTTEVTDVTHITAICNGEVTYDGGANVTDKGVCWSTNHEPTVSDPHASCGDGTGAFSARLTGLNNNTTYYVRSYAVNIAGTSYGDEVRFSTPPLTDIKILSIGNSYSEDALSYVPFILENMNIEVNIRIGILSKGGATLANHVDYFENQTPDYTYYLYDGEGAWQNLGQQTVQFALDNYDWDIITLQQFSGGAPIWSTYQPSLDTLTSLLYNYVTYPVKFGWYMVQSRPAMSYLGPNYPDDIIVSNYTSIASNAQRVLDETLCEFVIPVGTAIQNARTVPAIKALGDYANISENTSGLGYLVCDGSHLQEGLPCQIAAYSFILSILEQYGALQAYSILGESTRVTSEWLAGKQIPGANGTPVGSDDANCLIGQWSAFEAFNNPYEITDMNE